MLTRIRRASPVIIISGVLLVMIASAAAIILNKAQPTTPLYLGSAVFDAKIAYTQQDREKGYGGVSTIPDRQALILAFTTTKIWPITMKDMKVPIDVIWLSADKKVVAIEKNIAPDGGINTLITPKQTAQYIVEVPAGTVKAKAISVGRTAIFDIKTEDIQE